MLGIFILRCVLRNSFNKRQLAGAELHFNEPVMKWNALPGGGVSVRTARERYDRGSPGDLCRAMGTADPA